MVVKVISVKAVNNSRFTWLNLKEDCITNKILFIILYEKLENHDPHKGKIYSAYVTAKMLSDGLGINVDQLNNDKPPNGYYLSEIIIEGELVFNQTKEQFLKEEKHKQKFLNK